MTEEQMLKTLNTIIDMRLRKVKMDCEGTEWVPEDTERLKSMYSIGYGITSLALMLDRTEDEIIKHIQEIGIYHYDENIDETRKPDDE